METEKVQKKSSAILKFLQTRSGYYISTALRSFEAKPIAQLLYSAHLGLFSNFTLLELVQPKFLRLALQVHKIPRNRLHERRGYSAGDPTQLLAQKIPRPTWLCLTVRNEFQSTRKKTVTTKILSLGLPQSLLLRMGIEQAKVIIKQHIADTKHQLDLSRSPTFIASESHRYSDTPWHI